MAAKNYAVIDKNQWNVYIQVLIGVLCAIGLTVVAALYEDIRYEAVTGFIAIAAYFTKGPGFKNAAKAAVKNDKEEDDEIAADILQDLLSQLPVDKLGKVILKLPNESREKISTSSAPVTPEDSSASESKKNEKTENNHNE